MLSEFLLCLLRSFWGMEECFIIYCLLNLLGFDGEGRSALDVSVVMILQSISDVFWEFIEVLVKVLHLSTISSIHTIFITD